MDDAAHGPEPQPNAEVAELDGRITTRLTEPLRAPDQSPGRIMLAVALVAVSFNLRPLFSSLAALMPEVRATTGASPAVASLLTTAPVLCLGLFASAAPGLTRRFGAERVIFGLLLVLTAGTALRGFGSVPAILIGSIMAGGAIAVINVLLPSLVKRDFPHHIPSMTGLYSMALCLGAAVAAAGTVPIDRALDDRWPAALASWALPVMLATLLWMPHIRRGWTQPQRQAERRVSLIRQPLAWQVTFFMGLQSALAYSIFGWFAPLLRARGLDAAVAGYVVFLCVMVQTAASLVAPSLATRGRDQRWASVALVAAATVGFLGCLFAPVWTVWGWTVLQGIGQGGLISVALTVIVLRAPDARTAADLSSLAQSVGYTLAAFGPLLIGLIFTKTGNPQAPAVPIVLLGLGCAFAGWGAGRNTLLRA